jgi:hypothetical protein
VPGDRKLRLFAGCECSGRVRDAFAARGWEAWSADLLPSETPVSHLLLDDDCYDLDDSAPEGTHHYQGDVRDLFDWYHPVNSKRRQELTMREAPPLWDLFIGFPPCTHLSLAGARYWKQKRTPRYDEYFEETWSVQDEAAAFFMEMAHAPAAHVAVENPRGDMTRRYRPPDQYVQPYMFGDPLAKLTGLWLEALPPLVPDNLVEPTGRVATGGGSYRTDIKAGRGPNNTHEDARGRVNRQRERNRTLPGFARAMAEQWGAYIEEQHGRI